MLILSPSGSSGVLLVSRVLEEKHKPDESPRVCLGHLGLRPVGPRLRRSQEEAGSTPPLEDIAQIVRIELPLVVYKPVTQVIR